MKKSFYLLIIILILFYNSFPVELGGIIGDIKKPTGLVYGFSFGSGLIIPMVKYEFELLNITGSEYKTAGIGLKLRPKLGDIAPYIVVGVGTDFLKILNFDKDNYKKFTFYGAGFYYFFTKMVSIRIDFRLLNYSELTKTRITGGIFLNL